MLMAPAHASDTIRDGSFQSDGNQGQLGVLGQVLDTLLTFDRLPSMQLIANADRLVRVPTLVNGFSSFQPATVVCAFRAKAAEVIRLAGRGP